jgi:hypothetical protein
MAMEAAFFVVSIYFECGDGCFRVKVIFLWKLNVGLNAITGCVW